MSLWTRFRNTLLILTVCFGSGCSRELSRIGGVSIKRSHANWGGQLREQGRLVVVMSMADFLSNHHRGLRVISSADISKRYKLVSPSMPETAFTEQVTSIERAIEETFDLSIKVET